MDAEAKGEELREDDRILQAIDKCLTSKDDLYDRNKAILKEILEDVFTTIKGRDGFFREQFQDFFFVEKYYKGPRVSEPEEFHVHIIIKIPLNYDCIQLTGINPGYRTLQLDANSKMYQPQWNKYSIFVSNWLVYKRSYYDSGIYTIDGNAFQQSIESLLEWDTLNVPKLDNYTIKVCKNNAAFTQLCINKQGYPEMNVNLVPVIEFNSQPPSSLAKTGFKWYTVPNPSKDLLNKFQWRIVLCNHENDLLTRHSYLTPFIRQLDVHGKLRDIQEWNAVPYYHIKTLFIHYARSIENDSGLPDTLKLTGIKLLIHILDRLRNMCKTQHLEDAWYPQHNLVDADESQFANIVEQLKKMIIEISDDPAKVVDWIFTSEELSTYENELKAVGIIRNTDRPSNNLQMSENDEPGSAASGDIESSPSTEAGHDKAGCLEEISRVTAGLKDSIDMLSRRLAAVEHKLQDVPNVTQKYA